MNDRDGRISKILEQFLRTPSVTASALAVRLGVSERTIRNDIRALDGELKGSASIESDQGRSVLRIYDAERFHEICAGVLEGDRSLNSPRARTDRIFGLLLRAEAPIPAEDLAEELNVGRTTLMNDLKRLRADVEIYRVAVAGTSRGLTIKGNESDIRHYVLENAWESLYSDYPIEPEIDRILEESFADGPYEKSARDEFRRFLVVMLDRFLTDHPLGELTPSFYGLTARPEFEAVDRMAGRIGEFLGIELPPEERLFILLPLIGTRTPADIQNMRAIELDEGMRELGEEIFRQIRQELDIRIEDPEAIEEFLYHLMFMTARLKFHVRLKSPLLEELREKYPLAWRMAGIAARVVAQEEGLTVTPDERAFLATYFGVFLEERGEEGRPFRAALLCGPGRITGRLVAAQLRKVLDSSVELSPFSSEAVTPELLASFDLIFTTVDLPCPTDRPVIRIQEVFNEQALRQKIEKARYWDRVDVPVLDDNWFVMGGLLDEGRFFPFGPSMGYEEAVERMAADLTAQGLVDEGFPERLRERERKGTMVFDHAVAIPHAVQRASPRLVLAIGACPEPIHYRDQEIRVIFLMGVPEAADPDDGMLIRVYEEIISVAQDAVLLEKVSRARDLPELLRALYRQA